MQVSVRTEEGYLSIESSALEVARMVASSRGFHLDCEPGEVGRVRLTAAHPNGTTKVLNGTTADDVAAKLMKWFASGAR